MTTRSQKRKAVAELVSGDFQTPVTENAVVSTYYVRENYTLLVRYCLEMLHLSEHKIF